MSKYIIFDLDPDNPVPTVKALLGTSSVISGYDDEQYEYREMDVVCPIGFFTLNLKAMKMTVPWFLEDDHHATIAWYEIPGT